MPPGKWTQEELDFLDKTYVSIEWSVGQIADYLERSEHSVVKKASSRGMKKVRCSNIPTPEGHKVCRTCKQIVPHTNFYKNNAKDRRGDGYDSSCKDCVRKRESARRLQTKMKELEERIALEEQIPKEEFIKANQHKLFKCTHCSERKDISEFTVFMKNGRATRNSRCKKCANAITKERDLKKLREQGHI